MSTILDQLPIFIVTGANWTCEVKLDEDDVLFPLDEQIMEAATKAIEVFKNVTQSDTFVITNQDDSPYIGATIHVHIKGGDPERGHFILSHVALANCGFYKDSVTAFQAWNEQTKHLVQIRRQAQADLEKQAKKSLKKPKSNRKGANKKKK